METTIIGSGDFLSSTSTDYRSTYAAKLCRVLAALQSIDYYLSQNAVNAKIDLTIATDCLGVVSRLQQLAPIVATSTTLHLIAREILHLKNHRF